MVTFEAVAKCDERGCRAECHITLRLVAMSTARIDVVKADNGWIVRESNAHTYVVAKCPTHAAEEAVSRQHARTAIDAPPRVR